MVGGGGERKVSFRSRRSLARSLGRVEADPSSSVSRLRDSTRWWSVRVVIISGSALPVAAASRATRLVFSFLRSCNANLRPVDGCQNGRALNKVLRVCLTSIFFSADPRDILFSRGVCYSRRRCRRGQDVLDRILLRTRATVKDDERERSRAAGKLKF